MLLVAPQHIRMGSPITLTLVANTFTCSIYMMAKFENWDHCNAGGGCLEASKPKELTGAVVNFILQASLGTSVFAPPLRGQRNCSELRLRGVRWNIVRGAMIPNVESRAFQAFLAKFRAKGLHLELHLEGNRLANHLPALVDQGVNLVVDHFGQLPSPNPLRDPKVNAVKALTASENLYFKFVAHYRTCFDLTPHFKTLMSLLPDDHIVWVSDWPHTQHENKANYANSWSATEPKEEILDSLAAKALYCLAANEATLSRR